MKIHLRKRKQTANGSISLYLELYKGSNKTADGKVKIDREYEYLDLYLIDKPKTAADKQHNKDILQLAESIKSSRELDIKNGIYGFTTKVKQNADFMAFFEKMTEQRMQTLGNYGNWYSALKHLKSFVGKRAVSFKDIDHNFCEAFKSYLETIKKKSGDPLSSSAALSYYNKFKASLNEAVKKGIILSDPSINVKSPKAITPERAFLTMDELQALAKTKCRYEVLKRAFIFSCLTGLRWSDINKMTWSMVHNNGDRWSVTFHQKKTKTLQYHPISLQARVLLGEIGKPDERVFVGLKYSSYTNAEIVRWMASAGISKHITFHCARHTYAHIQQSQGTDPLTLMSLMGHSELKTTLIYYHMWDKAKEAAADKAHLPEIDFNLPDIEKPKSENAEKIKAQYEAQLKEYAEKQQIAANK